MARPSGSEFPAGVVSFMQNTAKGTGEPSAETSTEPGIITIPVKPTSSFGRWKPTIYWHTPIFMVLAAAVLLAGLSVLVRKLARKFEKEGWSEAARRQAYASEPSGSGAAPGENESTGAGDEGS